jgi:hypothetical protein
MYVRHGKRQVRENVARCRTSAKCQQNFRLFGLFDFIRKASKVKKYRKSAKNKLCLAELSRTWGLAK